MKTRNPPSPKAIVAKQVVGGALPDALFARIAVILERQIHTHLFLRLLKRTDQAGVLDLATRGQALERPIDTLRDPHVLDFLGLPEASQLREIDLESAIIAGLQHSLLELGKGFALVAGQKQGA